MRRLALLMLSALALAGALAAPAGAVELEGFDATFLNAAGEQPMGAGEHPAALITSFEVAKKLEGEKVYPKEAVKDLDVAQVEGLAGNVAAVEPCTTADFLKSGGGCPNSSALGYLRVELGEAGQAFDFTPALYSLHPAPGYVARLGFVVAGVRVTIDVGLSEHPPYRIQATLRNISQALEFFASELVVWGTPAATENDPYRGHCLNLTPTPEGELKSLGNCSAGIPAVPFLVNPRACEGPLATLWRTTSWQNPGLEAAGEAHTHGDTGAERGFGGCGGLPFTPSISAQPSSRAAASPSGLDFGIDVADPGYTDPPGLAGADIERTVVTLPRGMTVNPSQAEGLEVCSEADVARESSKSAFGAGCPAASKIGTIEVESPALPEALLKGSLFVAEPYANPSGSLIALYAVISDASLGISIVQPIKVSPDPETGQLISTAENMPQLPFSHFRLRFREGGRSPLITPPGCGRFETEAVLHPYSGGSPVTSTSDFEILAGPGGGPCPRGPAPFAPGFGAGTLNNAAKSFSPFQMRLTRGDGEQDLTRFSATLPPGVGGIIAGVSQCSDAEIARARSRTGRGGGGEELTDPSCPANSKIGSTLAGAGVGSQLTYVPGSLYLAGPYGGDPLSVAAITPALAGPFDAGTVVVRVGLRLNPVSGEVEADGAASDPIPHILQGIPLNVRELRVSAERQSFTFNATSCAPEQARATLWGGGTVLDPTPDSPVAKSARYQASSCASLPFKPKLAIKLRGGTRRGAHPALRAVVSPRAADANFKSAVVTLPRSAFLDQAHIRTICTRVQFAAGAGNGANCPKGSIYGKARAWTPILDKPAEGPVFLRSSSHNLPDMVIALKGPPEAAADVEVSARIDSIKGGIRASFEAIPDLPVSRFILDMRGGAKGLIVNSRNLCHKAKRNRAHSVLGGQNGRRSNTRPVVRATKCKRAHKRRHHRRANTRVR